MKALLRRARLAQPFNRIATATTRAVLTRFGLHSELIVRHLHRAGCVDVQLPNGRRLTLWSRGDDWVSNQLFWRGLPGYEPETVPVFLRYASQAPVIIDVGAYVGFYSLLAAHANPAAQVYAFEPHPDAHARLVANVRRNGLDHVECLDAAVADFDGTGDLLALPVHLPTSSSLSSSFMAGHETVKRLPVRVIRLDQFTAERRIPRVGLVKVDTESTEPAVLRGMLARLESDRPPIICEVLAGRGAEADLEKILDPLGYRYYLLTPSGPERRARIVGHPEWLNYLFTCGEP